MIADSRELDFLSDEYRKTSLVCQKKMTQTILRIDLFRKTESMKKISGIAEVETILGTYYANYFHLIFAFGDV